MKVDRADEKKSNSRTHFRTLLIKEIFFLRNFQRKKISKTKKVFQSPQAVRSNRKTLFPSLNKCKKLVHKSRFKNPDEQLR